MITNIIFLGVSNIEVYIGGNLNRCTLKPLYLVYLKLIFVNYSPVEHFFLVGSCMERIA